MVYKEGPYLMIDRYLCVQVIPQIRFKITWIIIDKEKKKFHFFFSKIFEQKKSGR